MSIRIALIDDHSMVRQALASILDAEADIEVVAQGGSRQEARGILSDFEIDVVVLDYHMPDGGALEVLSDLADMDRDPNVLVLTVHDSVHYALRTLDAGAHGFMIKSSAVEELVEAIHAVQRGQIYVTPKYRQEVETARERPRNEREGLSSLSDREFEILRELAAGKSLKETAYDLDIGVSTVSTYRSRILKKLGFESSSELIRFAVENGIVS